MVVPFFDRHCDGGAQPRCVELLGFLLLLLQAGRVVKVFRDVSCRGQRFFVFFVRREELVHMLLLVAIALQAVIADTLQ